MFHGSCRRVSRVLSLALEPISKSGVHYLASILSSKIIIASKPRYMLKVSGYIFGLL